MLICTRKTFQNLFMMKIISKVPVYQFPTHASFEKSTATVTSQNSVMFTRRSVATHHTAKTCTLSATFPINKHHTIFDYF